MTKPPLSMQPTGWFQVAWSDEIKTGDLPLRGFAGRFKL